MPDALTPLGLDTAAPPAPSPNAAPPASPGKPAPLRDSPESVRKGSALDDAFKQIDTKAGVAPAEKPPETPGKPKTPDPKQPKEPEPGEDEEDDEVALPTEQEKEAARKAAEGKETAGKDGKKPNLLREDREKQKARADAAEKRASELEAKHKAAEERLTRLEAAEAKAQAAEKRMAEVEDRLRLTNYERSDEYQKQFYQPYVEAYNAAYANVQEFMVTLADGNQRPATQKDFDAIMSAPNSASANALAQEMFGVNAPDVIADRKEVMRKLTTMRSRLNEAMTNGAAKEQEQQAQTKAQQAAQLEARNSNFEKEFKAVSARHEWYKEVEGDEQWNKALAKGAEISSKVFGERKGTVEELAKLDAAVYARSLAYSPMKVRIKRLTAKVAELEKSLAEYEETKPGKDTGGNGEGKAPNQGSGKALDSAFAEIDKRASAREARSW